MAKTSAIITSTDPTTGKTLQKTLTDINPDASNEQIATFGGMLNAITGNGYVNTFRVDKVNCDLESGGGKSYATITFTGGNTQPMSLCADIGGGSNGNYPFTYNGSSPVYARFVTPFKRIKSSTQKEVDNTDYTFSIFAGESAGNYQLSIRPISGTAPSNVTQDVVIELYTPEDDDYKATTATFTLTV